nr:CC-chemokine family protein [Oriental turtle dovepox virus]
MVLLRTIPESCEECINKKSETEKDYSMQKVTVLTPNGEDYMSDPCTRKS